MRVLHIYQKDDPDAGGALRVAEALVREQHKSGIDAHLLFLYGSPGKVSASLGDRSCCLGLTSSREVLKGLPALKQAIKHIDPDIIHSHDGILWPRLALFKTGIPVITHAHLPPEFNGGLKRLLGWPWVKKTTDRVIGISDQTSGQWIEAGIPADQVEIIPNGVDFERFSPISIEDKKHLRSKLGLPPDQKIILWVGRLHQEMKGTDRAEQVASYLPDDVTLVMAGNGSAYEGICTRNKTLIQNGQLIMAGSIEHPEDYYKAADAYLFTSYWEPFGLVILEAIACALPVLSFPVTRGGGAVQLLDEFDSVKVEDDASAEEIQKALSKLWKREGHAAEMQEKASSYSWAVVSQRVMGLYKSVLGEMR